MQLSEDKIKEIVRNHFEKRLLDASEEFILETETVRSDPVEGFSPGIIRRMREENEKRLAHYSELKRNLDYDEEQENVAYELLEAHEIPTEKSNVYIHQLCMALVRAHHEAERIYNAYLNSEQHNGEIRDPYFENCLNFFENPDPALFFEYEGKPYYKKDTSITLHEAYNKFYSTKINEAKQQGKRLTGLNEYEGYFNRLFDLWDKNKEISEFTKSDCSELKDCLIRFPHKYDQNFGQRGISLKSVIDGEYGEYKLLGPGQAKKMWDAYKGLFSWAKHEKGYISENPFLDIKFKGKKHSDDDRDPFSEEQLKTLFTSPLYTGRKNLKKSFWIPPKEGQKGYVVRDGYFWLPLVGLYCGMRMGEILQLKIYQFHYSHDTFFFDLKDHYLKTGEGRRIIPIHPELMRIGLLQFIKDRQKAGKEDDYLFNNIPRPDPNRISNKYTNKFSEYIARIGIKTDKTSFHSFRHNFADGIRNAGIDERTQFALIGHAHTSSGKTTNYNYGAGSNIRNLYEKLSKLEYEFLDLSHLYVQK